MRKIETIAGFLLVVDLAVLAIIVAQDYLDGTLHAAKFAESIAVLRDFAIVIIAMVLIGRLVKRYRSARRLPR